MREYQSAPGAEGVLSLSGDNAPAAFVFGEDYVVGASSRSTEESIEAPVVFVGYGLVAEDHGRDDYAGLDVEGKIVAYLSGAPKFLNSEERAHYGATRAQRASERGAIGSITLYTPTFENRLPFARLAGFLPARKAMSCLLYTSPSPRDATLSRMPSSA